MPEGWGEGLRGKPTPGFGVFGWGDENVLELDSGDGLGYLINTLKSTELHTVKRMKVVVFEFHPTLEKEDVV